MARILAVIPTMRVINTGAIAGTFRLRAQVSADWQSRPFGYLVPQSDGVEWRLVLMEPPRGPLRRNMVSADMSALMNGLSDCVLLVDPLGRDMLQEACAQLRYDLTIQEFRGELATQ